MHYYQDVSNFRAPYDHAAVGATPDPAEQVKAALFKGPDGLWHFKPEVAKQIMESLPRYQILNPVEEPPHTELVAWTKEVIDAAAKDAKAHQLMRSQSGDTWVKRQLGLGRVVFGSLSLIAADPSQKLYLGAVDAGDTARLKEIAALDNTAQPVLADPRTPGQVKVAGAASPLVVGLGIAAVVGLGLYVWSQRDSGEKITL